MIQSEIDELEKCIDILMHGGTIEDCFSQFPDLSPEVQDNLKTANEMIRLSENEISPELMARSRARMIERAASYRGMRRNQKPGEEKWLLKLKRAFSILPSSTLLAGRVLIVIGITVLLIIFSRGLMITSAKSLPGDSLYPVKRAVEDIQVYLSPNQQHRLEHEENFNQVRVGEVISLLDLKRTQQVSFEGILEKKGKNQWIVSGITVAIQPETKFINGITGTEEFSLGSSVEVEGTTNSTGGVNAKEIHLREYLFDGEVEKIDQSAWQISGYKISVNSGTKIEDGIHIGDSVVVLLHSADDGFYALSIHVEGQVTPTPQIQPSPLSTPLSEGDSTEIYNMEQHDPIQSINTETMESQDNEEEEMNSTPVVTSEDEHISTPVPQNTEEPEYEDKSNTPENQESPELTDTHEGEP